MLAALGRADEARAAGETAAALEKQLAEKAAESGGTTPPA
jgi:hypothetical protein